MSAVCFFVCTVIAKCSYQREVTEVQQNYCIITACACCIESRLVSLEKAVIYLLTLWHNASTCLMSVSLRSFSNPRSLT